jgi:hypothetical protein
MKRIERGRSENICKISYGKTGRNEYFVIRQFNMMEMLMMYLQCHVSLTGFRRCRLEQ